MRLRAATTPCPCPLLQPLTLVHPPIFSNEQVLPGAAVLFSRHRAAARLRPRPDRAAAAVHPRGASARHLPPHAPPIKITAAHLHLGCAWQVIRRFQPVSGFPYVERSAGSTDAHTVMLSLHSAQNDPSAWEHADSFVLRPLEEYAAKARRAISAPSPRTGPSPPSSVTRASRADGPHACCPDDAERGLRRAGGRARPRQPELAHVPGQGAGPRHVPRLPDRLRALRARQGSCRRRVAARRGRRARPDQHGGAHQFHAREGRLGRGGMRAGLCSAARSGRGGERCGGRLCFGPPLVIIMLSALL